jgi:hypothetical protein
MLTVDEISEWTGLPRAKVQELLDQEVLPETDDIKTMIRCIIVYHRGQITELRRKKSRFQGIDD